jgi:hypothetical protein
LSDRPPRPDRIGNRIPDAVRENIIQLALDPPALSPRELAVRFTDSQGYFVSEATVYSAEGAGPDRQPGLYRDQGRRRVQGQDHPIQSALATDFTYL